MVGSIDHYIAGFPADTQTVLCDVRRTIATALPGAEEMISYKIPAFRMNGGDVIYFAGNKNHIGVYPVHNALPDMADAIAPYLSGKATAKFPLNQPIPLDLVAAIARQLARINVERMAKKKGSRT